MEREREKPWRRNAPNELIVNSILAAVATIMVQTIATGDQPKYGVGWLVVGLGSLVLFLISTEQLAELIREDEITLCIRSMMFYNFGVLLLILSLCAIFARDVENRIWSIIIGIVLILIWAWFWGLDVAFLICRNEHYRRWKRKMDGEPVDEEILDYRDMLATRIKRWTHWE